MASAHVRKTTEGDVRAGRVVDFGVPCRNQAELDAKVKALREDGEKMHKSGQHGESMKALGEAKKLLGI